MDGARPGGGLAGATAGSTRSACHGFPGGNSRAHLAGEAMATGSSSKQPHEEDDGHEERHENRVEEPELQEAEAGVDSGGKEGQEETRGRSRPDPNQGENSH